MSEVIAGMTSLTFWSMFHSLHEFSNAPLPLSAVQQIHSPLKAVVTSVKGPMQMQQLLDNISIILLSNCFRFAPLNRHTSLVADPQLGRISEFTEIDGEIQHLVTPYHRIALPKSNPCRPV